MLKQDITYRTFDDEVATETLYFNITKSELLDQLDLGDKLEDLQKRLGGEERTLTTKEIQEVLDLVKLFMRLSYGVRSEDGKRFLKNAQVWEEFTQTATYDAFLFSLFEEPEKAITFMVNVLPSDLVEKAREIAEKNGTAPTEEVDILNAKELPQPERELTDEEILKMDPKDMTHEQLQRAFYLKAKADAQ